MPITPSARSARPAETVPVSIARTFPPPGANWKYADLPFDPQHSEHGTHVAGIAAGDYNTTANDGTGPVKVSGIARGAIRGLWIVATNTAHSWINQSEARALLALPAQIGVPRA